ncbi:MAG: type II secretion system protein [Planctomycetota bacterium]|jgi:type II secretory pathway pseudopilin PulG|nr:type II secretion system protein [Planctomycetota bacterium]
MAARSPAFTLIELLIAVSLGIVVLLVATKSFTTVAAAIGQVGQLREQNDLLRNGYLLALDDADHWNSQANPHWPYLKGYNALGDITGTVVDGSGNPRRYYDGVGKRLDGSWGPVADPLDVHWNKRPFKRVELSASDPRHNPNWVQAHDRRSWCRNYLMATPRPISRGIEDGETMVWTYASDGDGNAANIDAATSLAHSYQVPGVGLEPVTYRGALYSQRGQAGMPYGWTPRHAFGDYSLVSHVEMDPSSADPREAAAAARPGLMLETFKQLGLYAVAEYLPRGTQSMLQRPNRNAAGAFVDADAVNFNQGEMPGQLVAAATDGSADSNARTVWIEYPTASDVDAPNRTDYLLALYRPTRDAHRNVGSFWVSHDFHFMGRQAGGEPMFLGTRMNTKPDGTPDPWHLLDRLSIFPWGARSRNDEHVTWDAFGDQMWRNFYGSVTIHHPQTYTDDPYVRLNAAEAGTTSIMKNHVMRCRIRSDEVAYLQVTVVDPDAARVIEISFSAPATTSYRGARQMWALKSAASTGSAVMGDVYVP